MSVIYKSESYQFHGYGEVKVYKSLIIYSLVYSTNCTDNFPNHNALYLICGAHGPHALEVF